MNLKIKFVTAALALCLSPSLAFASDPNKKAVPQKNQTQTSGEELAKCFSYVAFSLKNNINGFSEAKANAALAYFLTEGEKKMGLGDFGLATTRTDSQYVIEYVESQKLNPLRHANIHTALKKEAGSCMNNYEASLK